MICSCNIFVLYLLLRLEKAKAIFIFYMNRSDWIGINTNKQQYFEIMQEHMQHNMVSPEIGDFLLLEKKL